MVTAKCRHALAVDATAARLDPELPSLLYPKSTGKDWSWFNVEPKAVKRWLMQHHSGLERATDRDRSWDLPRQCGALVSGRAPHGDPDHDRGNYVPVTCLSNRLSTEFVSEDVMRKRSHNAVL